MRHATDHSSRLSLSLGCSRFRLSIQWQWFRYWNGRWSTEKALVLARISAESSQPLTIVIRVEIGIGWTLATRDHGINNLVSTLVVVQAGLDQQNRLVIQHQCGLHSSQLRIHRGIVDTGVALPHHLVIASAELQPSVQQQSRTAAAQLLIHG